MQQKNKLASAVVSKISGSILTLQACVGKPEFAHVAEVIAGPAKAMLEKLLTIQATATAILEGDVNLDLGFSDIKDTLDDRRCNYNCIE